MPLTSDDIVMGCTVDIENDVHRCDVCGYEESSRSEWTHTLTECLQCIAQAVFHPLRGIV